MNAQHLILCFAVAPIYIIFASRIDLIELEYRHGRGDAPIEKRKQNVRKLQAAKSRQACEEDKVINERNLQDTGLECRCEEADGGITLICVDACAYCNPSGSVCGINSAQAFYDNELGRRTAIGGVFKYEKGLKGMVAVENIGCVEDDNGRIISCQTCNVYANDRKCNSCEFQKCEDGRLEEMIDCSNIEPGAVFNFCGNVTVSSGLFQTFSDDQFDECLHLSKLTDNTPTAYPTPNPLKPASGSHSYSYSSSSSSSSSHKVSKRGKGGFKVYSKSAKKSKSRRFD